jgi:hypothetical protein
MKCTFSLFKYSERIVSGLILWLKKEQVEGVEGYAIMRSFIICTSHLVFLGRLNPI